jgi:hypothetical protein
MAYQDGFRKPSRSRRKERISSGKQLRAGLGEFDVGPGLVLPEPAALDRNPEAGTIFGRASATLEQEWPVDFLNVNPAVLHGFDGVGNLQQLARGGLRIGIGGFQSGRGVARDGRALQCNLIRLPPR